MNSIENEYQQTDPMRASIIDAARDLFSKYGYKKTTMEDIAAVLRKGKSSLYYYFKNKEDIFQVVLETEEAILFSRLANVVSSASNSKEKFINYVKVRMHTIYELENYAKNLKDNLYEGYEFIEKMKGNSEAKETAFLHKIIKDGMDDGTFSVINLNMAATGIAIALKGIEGPLLKASETPKELQSNLDNIINLLFYGIIKR